MLTSQLGLNEGNGIEEDAYPHDVASLMKQFLRELPDPLLTDELYNSFIQVAIMNDFTIWLSLYKFCNFPTFSDSNVGSRGR